MRSPSSPTCCSRWNCTASSEPPARRRRACSPHPGYAATQLQMSGPSGVLKLFLRFGNRFLAHRSAEMGSLPQLYAATAPPRGKRAVHRPGTARTRKRATRRSSSPLTGRETPDLARALWQESERLTGVAHGSATRDGMRLPMQRLGTSPLGWLRIRERPPGVSRMGRRAGAVGLRRHLRKPPQRRAPRFLPPRRSTGRLPQNPSGQPQRHEHLAGQGVAVVVGVLWCQEGRAEPTRAGRTCAAAGSGARDAGGPRRRGFADMAGPPPRS